MRGNIILGALLTSLTMLAPAASALSLDRDAVGDLGVTRIYDSRGEVIYEQMVDPGNPLLLKTLHYLRLGDVGSSSGAAKPGGGGSGGNDCASTAYVLAGWHWTKPFSTYASSYASIVNGALGDWDANTAASISGGASSGSKGTAGTQDYVNQIDWVNIGASTTIAVTTTWSYRVSGEAVESDGQYNTYYAWSTSGDPNSMDVENIVQHETGHTFGLNHPKGSGIECLTMYAYANYGETMKRTLGTGDILGIKAIYGN